MDQKYVGPYKYSKSGPRTLAVLQILAEIFEESKAYEILEA